MSRLPQVQSLPPQLKNELAIFLAASVLEPGQLKIIMDNQESKASKTASQTFEQEMSDLVLEAGQLDILDTISEDEWDSLT